MTTHKPWNPRYQNRIWAWTTLVLGLARMPFEVVWQRLNGINPKRDARMRAEREGRT